ncbi:aureocin A53 family class IId bacteriocin [Bacillus zhangzhouensis]|nr:aureocin A53 family class IId bacteriocin [Bacillus zhangzhouensis]
MVAFLRLVAQLGTKAAKWAWANKSTVINWIKNGATFKWISDKINSIING